ncbi:MAG: DUF3597 domain-containing protein [Nitratireductor sp.]
MSIFSRIKDAIWGSAEPKPEPSTLDVKVKPVVASASAAPKAAPAATAPDPAERVVDVATILDAAVKRKKQKLSWRTSIVDLMKALDLDSSFSARKELAKELGYDGDMKSSAKMNVWLHKQVIQKLKDNGGRVPSDLL